MAVESSLIREDHTLRQWDCVRFKRIQRLTVKLRTHKKRYISEMTVWT